MNDSDTTNAHGAEPYMPPSVDPPLGDLLQEQAPIPALPGAATGPTTTHELPSRIGAMFDIAISAAPAVPVEVVGRDDKRKRTIIVGDVDWQLCRQASDTHGVFWPAREPLYLQSADQLWALATNSDGSLTVICEVWAD